MRFPDRIVAGFYNAPMRLLTDMEKQRVCDLLTRLVGINSVVVTPEQANRDRAEERMADFLNDHLHKMGMVVELREVFPGRPNLIAHWPDQGGGRSLMLEAHMDTVSDEGMTVDPFNAQIRNGRIYGRGTCDTKGSAAAFLTALAIASESEQLPAEKLYYVGTMSEETGCFGAAELVKSGFRTDAAIVGEPTGCRVVTAHKGPLWMEIETRGRACHASVPDEGVNAIDRMARIVAFVHGPWLEYLQSRRHPLLDTSTMAATMIEGGTMINIIPASCKAKLDGRLIPGLPVEEVVAEFKRQLTAYLGDNVGFAITHIESNPPLDCPADTPLPAKLLDLCGQANGQNQPEGVHYFADSGAFSQAGIQSVLFGPGNIAQAHKADEYVDLNQLFQATEIILTLLAEHAGRRILGSTR